MVHSWVLEGPEADFILLCDQIYPVTKSLCLYVLVLRSVNLEAQNLSLDVSEKSAIRPTLTRSLPNFPEWFSYV